MKAILITITEEMTGTTELSEVLNKNFESLNEKVEKREDAILDGLKDMERRIIRSFNESIDIKLTQSLKPIIKRLDNIERHLGIDPNLLTEE